MRLTFRVEQEFAHDEFQSVNQGKRKNRLLISCVKRQRSKIMPYWTYFVIGKMQATNIRVAILKVAMRYIDYQTLR